MSLTAHTVTLNNGVVVPSLAFGTGTKWFVGTKGNDKQLDELNRDLVESIKVALQAGFRHVDTAEMYGTEKEVGVAVAEFLKESGLPRSSLFITTKVYHNIDNIPMAFSDSLARLGEAVGYVDLYLIHAPFWDRETKKITLKEAWEEMEKLAGEGKGKARAIGVSNFRVKDLKEVLEFAKIKPVLNQIEFHPYLPSTELKQFSDQSQIVTGVYGGLLPLTSFANEGGVKDAAAKVAAAKKKGEGKGEVSEGQVLLAWSLRQGNVVVTTTNKKERLVEYLSAQELHLSQEEAESISAVGREKNLRKFWEKEQW